jgi:hypothetical protein
VIELGFRGWFLCRLATDPDPYDEPRGVSGYVHAYAGELDLDRIVSFQAPAFVRSHGPPLGVTIDQVIVNGTPQPGHALVGARVELLDEPKFEGRNGVVAEDGFEPIYPFRLRVAKDGFAVTRSVVPADPEFPYPEFLAKGVEGAPNDIRDATGIADLGTVWQERLTALMRDLEQAQDPEKAGIAERIAFLREQIALPGRGVLRFFLARMRYEYLLKSPVQITDPSSILSDVDSVAPWITSFWLGGWDADVLCGYARGTLRLPLRSEALAAHSTSITDRRP